MSEQDQLQQDILWLRQRWLEEDAQLQLPESLRGANLLKLLDKDLQPEAGQPLEGQPAPGKAAPPRRGDHPLIRLQQELQEATAHEVEQAPPSRRRVLQGWMQMAACMAAAVLLFAGFYHISRWTLQQDVIQPEAAAGAASANAQEEGAAQDRLAPWRGRENPLQASDYAQVGQALASLQPAPGGQPEEAAGATQAPVAPMLYSAVTEQANQEDAGLAGGYSRTNLQVPGLDEADIVKTDGQYLYIYRYDGDTGGGQIAIVRAQGLQPVSRILLEQYNTEDAFFLQGDRLVLLQRSQEDLTPYLAQEALQSSGQAGLAAGDPPQEGQAPPAAQHHSVQAQLYDLSDRANPRLLDCFAQDGEYMDARLSGDALYIVSQKEVSAAAGDEAAPLSRLVPVSGYKGKGLQPLQAEQILLPETAGQASYVVISALRLQDGEYQTQAVLGGGDMVYMSADSLVIAGSSQQGEGTTLFGFAVAGEEFLYKASITLPGQLGSQFALDEQDGYLRVALCAADPASGQLSTGLYVLDDGLGIYGQLLGLAPGQPVGAVRYVGDRAYLVAQQEDDPLLVVDLADPANPILAGKFQAAGFAQYLQPLEGDLLLGLGQHTSLNRYGYLQEDGLELTLLDLSDPSAPREMDTFLIGNGGTTSEALENHRAVLYDAQRQWVGFPVYVYNAAPAQGEVFEGYLLFDLSGGEISLLGEFSTRQDESGYRRYQTDGTIRRAVLAQDQLYTVSQGRICSYALPGMEKTGELVL